MLQTVTILYVSKTQQIWTLYIRFFKFLGQKLSLQFPVQSIPVITHVGDHKVYDCTTDVDTCSDGGSQFTYQETERDEKKIFEFQGYRISF